MLAKKRILCDWLIIQNKKNLSDRDTVDEITENHYLQYFSGLPGFIQERPFNPSLLVHFRKRLGKGVINEGGCGRFFVQKYLPFTRRHLLHLWTTDLGCRFGLFWS